MVVPGPPIQPAVGMLARFAAVSMIEGSTAFTVTPCGALPTLIPRFLQASRSIWSKPIENVEMHLMFSGSFSITSLRHFSLRVISSASTSLAVASSSSMVILGLSPCAITS